MERYTLQKEDKEFYYVKELDETIGSITKGNKKWRCVLWKYVEIIADEVDTFEEAKAAFQAWAAKYPDGFTSAPGAERVGKLIQMGTLGHPAEIFKYVDIEEIGRTIYEKEKINATFKDPTELTLKQVRLLALKFDVTFRQMLDAVLYHEPLYKI
jgi:hypothetical protein